jgi:heat shock protein HslJ
MTDGPTVLQEVVLADALAEVHVTRQRRRPRLGRWTFPSVGTDSRLAVATVVLALGAVVLAELVLVAGDRDRATIPSPAPLSSAPASPAPSIAAEPDPAVDPLSLIWSTARIEQDWPGPLRSELAVGGPVIEAGLGPASHWDASERRWEGHSYEDPTGDVGPDVPWIDIERVGLGTGPTTVSLRLAVDAPSPFPEPAARWIAYGAVLDTDADGDADVRVGMDHVGAGRTRAWVTTLGSGQTRAWLWTPSGVVGPEQQVRIRDWVHPIFSARPDTGYDPREARFWFGPYGVFTFTTAPAAWQTPLRTYGWASLIEGGRVVATDFAPDVGWLVEAPQPEPLALIGPSWTVVSDQNDVSRSSGPFEFEQTVRLTPDGRVSIFAGCHRGTGRATVDGRALRIFRLDLTPVSCRPEVAELDARLMTFLTADDLTYRIEEDNGELELHSGSDTLWLHPYWGG